MHVQSKQKHMQQKKSKHQTPCDNIDIVHNACHAHTSIEPKARRRTHAEEGSPDHQLMLTWQATQR